MLTIIFEDQWLCAVDKPPRLLTHPSKLYREPQSCMSLLQAQLGCAVQPTHRLDRATSGVLLFSKDGATTKALMGAFERRTVAKEYLAVVRGHAPLALTVDRALKTPKEYLEPGQAPDQVAAEARTVFTTLAQATLPQAVGPYESARYSLVRAVPETGRTHQIRRHLNGASYPIVGDTRYGDGDHNRFFRTHFDCHRMMLHASLLRVIHPVSGAALELRAPLSGEYQRVVEALFGPQILT